MMVHHGPDNHAPFDHILVTTPVEVVKMRGKAEALIRGAQKYIVCAFCHHWINRPMVDKCKCPASCHAQVR